MKDKEYTIDELINNPSFALWVEGDLNERQAERWNLWVKKSKKNRELAIRAQQKISGYAFKRPALPDVQREWARVRADVVPEKQSIGSTRVKQVRKGRSRDYFSLFLKVAAVLLVGLFVGYAAYMYQDPAAVEEPVAVQRVQTNYAEKKTINLSDGSTIILAANSELSYKENWLDQPVKRVVLKGEAYFDIAPKEKKGSPKFVVETDDGTAAVWGTRFTMDTYGTGTRVVLAEGEVRILPENNTGNEETTTLEPGELVRFHGESSHIELKKVNPAVYTSWSTNELFFDNTPLSVLINRIERTYGVTVEVQDLEMLNRTLSGSVDFRSLNGLTDAVAGIFGFQIHQTGETLIIKQ
ncbi:FecR family protein [Fodinibius sediminis]|uniref:FecR family protein n=1 Tax=Fodinibius sediminis TaxID=1214077 RepID=A0A521DE61_9BACT|nr:FecR domain-containing protein [Fodinibius sediminis]SMO69926.1 FecR family protein [Fodinibius sediminis]